MGRPQLICSVLIVLLLAVIQPVRAANIEFSAFGDMTYGFAFGGPADEEAAQLFKQFGTDENPLNLNRGFGQVGTDFAVAAELTDHLSFFSEVNLQLERGGTSEIGLDMERNFLDYKIYDWLNLQVGTFFTPLGFHNRTLYSRAWLMYSVQIPDFDEEELGLLPTHSTGVNIYGNLSTGGAHSFNYAVSVTNGRGRDPVTLLLNRDIRNEKTVTALLEWVIPGHRDFRIGLSGWSEKIESFKVDALGDSVDIATAEPMELKELGFSPYMVLYGKHFNIILDYFIARQKDELGNLADDTFAHQGFLGEFSLNLMGGKLHPYVRYDFTKFPEEGGGPYISLREDGGVLTRHFIPEFKAMMVGVAYDLYAYNRLKLEYIRHLDGPRPEHGIIIQTAFGF